MWCGAWLGQPSYQGLLPVLELLEIPVEHALHSTAPEVVLLEAPSDLCDVLEVQVDHSLIEPEQNNTLLEPLETLILLTEQQQGPPGPIGDTPKSPSLAYTGDLLTDISYADGSSKYLSYDGAGRLVQVDFSGPVVNTRTHLAYDAAGRLARALETVL